VGVARTLSEGGFTTITFWKGSASRGIFLGQETRKLHRLSGLEKRVITVPQDDEKGILFEYE
jgi:hypothetical protein